jgi:hypothetical protein
LLWRWRCYSPLRAGFHGSNDPGGWRAIPGGFRKQLLGHDRLFCNQADRRLTMTILKTLAEGLAFLITLGGAIFLVVVL